jgi:hypothetical protein
VAIADVQPHPSPARVVRAVAAAPASPPEQRPPEAPRPDAFAGLRAEHIDDPREALLAELAIAEAPIVAELQEAERRTSAALLRAMERPDRALTIAKLLRELTLTHSAIARRLILVLDAADQLRARRLLAQAKGDDRES